MIPLSSLSKAARGGCVFHPAVWWLSKVACGGAYLTQQHSPDLVPYKINIQNFVGIDIQDIKLGAGPMHVK